MFMWLRRLFDKELPKIPTYRFGDFNREELNLLKFSMESYLIAMGKEWQDKWIGLEERHPDDPYRQEAKTAYALYVEICNCYLQCLRDEPRPGEENPWLQT